MPSGNGVKNGVKRVRPTWCAGCGDFGVLTALEKATRALGLDADRICLVTGIGCSGKLSSYFGAYGFHGLHGRTLPVATGAKLANSDLTVVAAGGDGDGYAIGLSHFIHAVRRNADLTYIVMDNNIYGLTTGQTSPTSRRGFRSKTSPAGAVEEPVNPLALALVSGITYLAQGFSGDLDLLTELITAGIRHRGFALINVLSPCVTFNPKYGYSYYKENISRVGTEHATDDRLRALELVMTASSPVEGLIYAAEGERPAYDEIPTGNGRLPAELRPEVSREEWAELLSAFV